jgi:hypothetical protein
VDNEDQEARLTADIVAEDPKLDKWPTVIVEPTEALQGSKQVDVGQSNPPMSRADVDNPDQEANLIKKTFAGDNKLANVVQELQDAVKVPANIVEELQDVVEVLRDQVDDSKPTQDKTMVNATQPIKYKTLVEVEELDQEAKWIVDTVAEDSKLANLLTAIEELAANLTEEMVGGDNKWAKVLEVHQGIVEVLQEQATDTKPIKEDEDKVLPCTKLEASPSPKFLLGLLCQGVPRMHPQLGMIHSFAWPLLMNLKND